MGSGASSNIGASEVRSAPRERDRGASARAISAAVLLLGIAAIATFMALGYGVEARRLPLVVGVPLTALATANLVIVVRAELRAHGRLSAPRLSRATVTGTDVEGGRVTPASAVGEAGLEDATDEGLSFKKSAASVGVIAILFLFLGLIPTAVLYTVGFMRGVGKERWTKSLASAGLLVLMFWAFRAFLNVRFYRGWLASEGLIPYFLPF